MTGIDGTSDTQGDGLTTDIGRRRFLKAAGGGAAVAGLAGCSGDGGGGGLPEGPITIGHLAPLENSLGVGSDRSGQMAVDALNEDGGVMDRDVEFVSADTRGAPSQAQTEAERLVQQEDVDVVVGTFVSEVTQAILDPIAEFGVPFIVTGSAAPSTVTDFIGQNYDRYRNFFRTGPINSNFQAEAMGDYADFLSDTHGWNSFAFLADDAAWTQPFSNILPGTLEDKGYDVVHQSRLSIETNDFSPVLSDVDESGADSIIRFFAHINGGPMLGEWHQLEYEFGVEGIHVTGMHPLFYQLSEGAATYETTSQSGAGGATAITENTMDFVESYRNRYSDADPPVQHPMYMGFNTYDAVNVYAAAVERASTWDYENSLDDIVDAMLRTDHTGVAGRIRIYGEDAEYPHDVRESRNDQGTIENFPITQWQPEGALECVYPEVYATADHMAPHWME